MPAFDADRLLASALHTARSKLRIDGTVIGRMAAELIVRCVERLPIERRNVDVGFGIIARDTTFVGQRR